MTRRGYSEVLSELKRVKDLHGPSSSVGIMAEALRWGYGSARTCFVLESYLYQADDLEPIILNMAAAWDGKDYLSGALHTAQRFYSEMYSS